MHWWGVVANPANDDIAVDEAGQQAVAGGGTDGRGRVGVGEPPAFTGQPVDVWGLQFRSAIAADIAVAEVVGIDQHDVGMGRGACGNCVTEHDRDTHQAEKERKTHGQDLQRNGAVEPYR